MARRIVSAAALFEYGDIKFVVPSPRHMDSTFHDINKRFILPQVRNLIDGGYALQTADIYQYYTQGFIDTWGNFHTRTEAWKIAESHGQIIKRVGGDDTDGGTLYSENLY